MLLYVTLGTNDLASAGRFYDAALTPLGFVRQQEDAGGIGYSRKGDVRCRLWVVTPHDGKPACFGNGVTIALVAETRQGWTPSTTRR